MFIPRTEVSAYMFQVRIVSVKSLVYDGCIIISNYTPEKQTFLKLKAARDQEVWVPVRGSSSFHGKFKHAVHSEPVRKTCKVASSKGQGCLAVIYVLLKQRLRDCNLTLIRFFFFFTHAVDF